MSLPSRLVDALDQLKGEYGARSRGKVIEILMEQILGNDDVKSISTRTNNSIQDANRKKTNEETNSLVLIRSSDDLSDSNDGNKRKIEDPGIGTGINLPGFVQRRTSQLRDSLSINSRKDTQDDEPIVSKINHKDLQDAIYSADEHWLSLYGHKPGETVVEAAMLWFARDLWPNVEASEGRPFTWTAANTAVGKLCPAWKISAPSLAQVMVVAGTLEDPFATSGLSERMPTLIRRFVNRFRRSRQVTSFETVESTMTIHGALKFLGLSTKAGSSISLSSIRDAYKARALEEHPDTGGATESMRQLNEAYQLLRELYRQR